MKRLLIWSMSPAERKRTKPVKGAALPNVLAYIRPSTSQLEIILILMLSMVTKVLIFAVVFIVAVSSSFPERLLPSRDREEIAQPVNTRNIDV